MNQQERLLHEISERLKKEQWQLATAESCTGGLIASLITEIPGSSTWFERGFVTYSNRAKQEMLGVPHELIATFGAVSEEVAASMATGAIEHSAAHFSVAVTGIAGPDGGSIEKPVGTVCFAWAIQNTPPYTLGKHFNGTRQEIRLAAAQLALDGILGVFARL